MLEIYYYAMCCDIDSIVLCISSSFLLNHSSHYVVLKALLNSALKNKAHSFIFFFFSFSFTICYNTPAFLLTLLRTKGLFFSYVVFFIYNIYVSSLSLPFDFSVSRQRCTFKITFTYRFIIYFS
jgi:hypothetical protein